MSPGSGALDDPWRDRWARRRPRPRPVRRLEVLLGAGVATATIAAAATYAVARARLDGTLIAPALSVVVIAMGVAFRCRRRRLRRACVMHRGAMCTNCAYPVTGRRCPECGEPFDAEQAARRWRAALAVQSGDGPDHPPTARPRCMDDETTAARGS